METTTLLSPHQKGLRRGCHFNKKLCRLGQEIDNFQNVHFKPNTQNVQDKGNKLSIVDQKESKNQTNACREEKKISIRRKWNRTYEKTKIQKLFRGFAETFWTKRHSLYLISFCIYIWREQKQQKKCVQYANLRPIFYASTKYTTGQECR